MNAGSEKREGWTRRIWLLAAACVWSQGAATAEPDRRAFELRTYVTAEGRLPALLARFRDHTCALFERHGMENLGYWVPTSETEGKENTLIYLIAHSSREAARENWKNFLADPDWIAARTASEADGKILAKPPESVFLSLTDYSPPVGRETGDAASGPRAYELRTYTAAPGKLDALHARFRDHTMALFSRHGMKHFGYWTPVGSSDTLIYLLVHPSREAGLASFAAFRADPDWIAARTASEQDGSLTVQPGGVRSLYLAPTDFSPAQ
jgi:hypothetical protein